MRRGEHQPMLRETIVRNLVLAVVVFVGALAGLQLAVSHEGVSPIWPPSGIALAALLLFGFRVWPGIVVGAFAANLLWGGTAGFSIASAAANGVEPVVGVLLLRGLPDFRIDLSRIRDVLALSVLGGGVAPISGALIGTAGACLSEAAPWSAFGELARVWWLGDALGVLVLASLGLSWGATRRFPGPVSRQLEALGGLTLLAVVGFVVWGESSPIRQAHYPLSYLPLPLLAWAALRFGRRGASISVAVLAAFAFRGAATGNGPFIRGVAVESLLLTASFTAVVSVGAMLISAAMTQRRRAERALRRSERRLRTVIDLVPQMIFAKDREGRFLLANRAVGEWYGTTPDRLVSRPQEELHGDPEELRSFLESDRWVIAEGRGSFDQETTIRDRDGRDRILEVSKIPFEVQELGGRAVLGVAVDVTESRMAERRFRDLVESAPDALVIADADRKIRIVNRQTESMFGYSRSELLGGPIDVLIPERFRDRHEQYVRSFVHQPKTKVVGGGLELFGLRSDGSELPVDIALGALRTREGTLVAASIRDATEQRRVEDALRLSTANLEARNETLRAVNRIAERLHGSLDFQTVLEQAVESMREYRGSPAVSIESLDEEKSYFHVVHAGGFAEEEVAAASRIPVEGSLSGLAASRGDVVVSTDIPQDPRVESAARQVLTRHGRHSAVAIPLQNGGRVLGAMNLLFSEPREFTGFEREALLAIGQTVALAMANARYVERVEKEVRVRRSAEAALTESRADLQSQNEALETIRSLSHWMVRSADERAVAERTVQIMTRYTRAPSVALYRLESSGRSLRLLAARDFSEEAVRAAESLPMDGSLNGIAVARRDIVAVENLLEDESTEPQVRRLLVSEGYRSVIVVPLSYRERVIGTLNLVFPETRTFSRGERENLLSIARTVGLALANAEYVARIEDEITERKRAEEAVRALNEELEERVRLRTVELERAYRDIQAANAELKSFSYSVSHDLRAPLRAIQGFASILDRRFSDQMTGQARRHLGNIIDASDRMDHLIEDLLRFSRIGRTKVERRPVALGSVLDEVAVDLRTRCAEAGIRLEIPAAGELPEVESDPTLLRQVFANILENAVTYHRPGAEGGPWVKVECVCRTDRVILTVRDNGIGIDPQYHEKIFNVFQRLHSVQAYPGTGIGLATVKKALDLLGGRVRVESEPGAGSAFRVELPAGG